jgi:hypothetical protein
MRQPYTAKQVSWLREHCASMSCAELTAAFNVRWGQQRTVTGIKSTLRREGIRSGRKPGTKKGALRLFTAAHFEFIKDAYPRMPLTDVLHLLNKEFGTSYTRKQLYALTKNHGVKCGRTGQFQPGQVPPNKGVKGWQAGGRSAETRFKKGRPPHLARNYVPIGSTRISKDGYMERKVTDDPSLMPARRWAFEHRLIWEAANGPIPEGHAVVFLDGDRANVQIENLRCVPRAALQYMNKTKMNETTGEARKAAILTAELVTRANQRARA